MLATTFSNRIELLYEQLKSSLYGESAPFARRLIVVPSPPLKTWLMLQLAKDPQLGIAAGLEIGYLDDTLHKLKNLFGRGSSEVLPTHLELALGVEWEIRKCYQEEDDVWQPLRQYIGAIGTRKGERRLTALSEKLAHLFLKYGKFGATLLKEWETQAYQGWQQMLWQRLFVKTPWTTPYREFSKPLEPIDVNNLSLHVFSLSFLPKLYFNFLSGVAEQVPVQFYLLSPCEVFWSDTLSPRQRSLLTRHIELEQYLKECNPLLANFGRVGREMAKQIEESYAIANEEYAEIPRNSILDCIQDDMLRLENAATKQKTAFTGDSSIQVHSAPTLMREVEVLRDRLLHLLDRHRSELFPHEIIVMAPNIMDYEPFIKAVFPAHKGLEAQIMDVRASTQNSTIQGFLQLIELSSSRWDASTLLTLFENPVFLLKQKLSVEDLAKWREWIKDCAIRWGIDRDHRTELLGHGAASPGTWEFGFERLMAGLIMDQTATEEIAPYPKIQTTDSELLGKLIHLVKQLQKDLHPLMANVSFTLHEWSKTLQGLLQSYLDAKEGEVLTRFFNSLRQASKRLPKATFSFPSIRKHLQASLEQANATYRETHLHAIKFCSLLPMRTLPAKVIVLLGMQEGAFPRQEPIFSLNLMQARCDYSPSQVDLDRYAFLEALLSARQYFLLSYMSRNADDFKELPPALLVTELLNYLDSGYTVDDQLPSKRLTHQHPLNGFHASYFAKEAICPSYSAEYYAAACAYYQIKKPPHRLFESFSVAHAHEEEAMTLQLQDLLAFAKDPFKAFFNKRLGIYLRSENDCELPIEDPFLLNRLQFYKLRSLALGLPAEKALNRAEQQGFLPPALFRDAERLRLEEEISELKLNCQLLQIKLEESITIEFSDRHEKASQDPSGNWKLPALQVENTPIKIQGTISDINPKGLILHAEKKLPALVKAWPQFLAFLALVEKHQLAFEPNLILLKSGDILPPFEHSQHLLKQYIDIYRIGLANGCPLLPEWVEHFFKSTEEQLSVKLKEQTRTYSECALFQRRGMDLPNAAEWMTHAKNIYGPLYARL